MEAEEIPAFALRFHLHPAVTPTPQEDGASVLLRLPSGATWRLRARGGRVLVEDSVQVFGEAKPSKQVVVLAEAGTGNVQWAIGRVAASEG